MFTKNDNNNVFLMNLSKHNELCELLGITFPIIQGGMAWASDALLAASVSEAGGLGTIGCGGRDFNWIIHQIKIAKENTSLPFALNFPLDGTNNKLVDLAFGHALEQGVKLFTVSGSSLYSELLKKFGEQSEIVPLVGTVMQAKLAQRSGAKAIICEGQEAGGSIGKLSLLSLLPQVVDAVSIPVIAAGGIVDGRGINAAIALGASGVQLGTRFLASEECPVDDSYKHKITKSSDVDSNIIFGRIGRASRVLKNKYSSQYLSMELQNADPTELLKFSRGSLRRAAFGDTTNGALMAGESSGLIKDVMPTAKIMETLISQSVLSKINPKKDNIVNKFLQHKPPILLVDEIIDIKPGNYCITNSKFDIDRWFFDCHFPGNPIMPGSLLMELMSQTMTIIVNSENAIKLKGINTVISQVEKIKFLRPVLPKMEILTYAEIISNKRSIVRGAISCKSDDELICSCEMVLFLNSP